MSSRSVDDDRVQIDQVFVMCSLVYFHTSQSELCCMTYLARYMNILVHMYGVRSRLAINAPGPRSASGTRRKHDTSELSYRTTLYSLPWTSC
jgi:hypothetical protein